MRFGQAVVHRARYGARAARAVMREPYEGVERIRERIAERADREGRPYRYDLDANWHETLHRLLHLVWPCLTDTEFEQLWPRLVAEMRARGITLGRGTFGGWDDGSRELARAAYCVTRNLRARTIVETGVARGITSRCILEALELNGARELWSIDLPPLIATSLAAETGIAVPRDRCERWTLLRGSSRRHLPKLLRRLTSVDLFVHDSMHTARNVAFELKQVWPRLSRAGIVIIDDVDYNRVFADVAGSAAITVVAPREIEVLREGTFGIVVKDDPAVGELP
jgi:predicted O-methyltransferase YrrM